ncbi:uncharacterized protein [Elaeis guineensis]|uniref:Uncharacterized protein LOC105046425 isoform X1 n=1 Tax=Elaeis guineensis var. tenera TaxID=51953 RepID=A0A8N4I8T6_ELAGV|nr:uncharacterized protein LOC105046425 isoform X1 [Elaeis guineensis]
MDLFHRAKAVRLRSHHDKYLMADDDEEHVRQDRNGASRNVRWTVEIVDAPAPVLRLKSLYGRYLTASNEPFLLGVTGRKVLQTVPPRLDSSVEWEPIRDGVQAKLKTRYGHFLRANGGLPPWRNSVTHDIPHRTATQDWILWDVDVIDIIPSPSASPRMPYQPADHNRPSSPANMSPKMSKMKSSSSFSGSPRKVEGRTIHYYLADDDGNLDESFEGSSFVFNGPSVEELTHKLEEETNFSDIIVCYRNPVNGKLCPLHLTLPPNNMTMHVVVVQASSKVLIPGLLDLNGCCLH